MNKKKLKKIYFWANNIKKNNGEGILARNFIKLLKLKYKSYEFVNLNKFKHKNHFFYNYILPIYGAFKVRSIAKEDKLVTFINYLPLWNFLLFLIIPKNVILGPITGTSTKNSVFYKLLINVGAIILAKKRGKILLSNNHFKKKFINLGNCKIFSDFIFYNFTKRKKIIKKKYDIIFYYRNNSNKGNEFLLEVIKRLSHFYKVVVVGDKINFKNKNTKNFFNISRMEVLNIIKVSRYAIASKENLYSFFSLDCLSHMLPVYYNDTHLISNKFSTNLLLPYKFGKVSYFVSNFKKNYKSNFSKPKLSIKIQNFQKYLDF